MVLLMEQLWTEFQQCTPSNSLISCYDSTFGIFGHALLAIVIMLATTPIRSLPDTGIFGCTDGGSGWFGCDDGGDRD